MIKVCIFDLDGTLLNTLVTIRYYLNTTFKKFGIPEISLEKCREFVGAGARNLMSRCFEYFGINDPELFERAFAAYNVDYDARPTYLTKPYPGIRELITALRADGIKLAVLSNKPDFATRAIVEEFFPDCFSVVHGGREGIPLKPSADGVAAILSELSADPSVCAYIGDSEIDVCTAKAFSPALPIAVSWGFRTEGELSAAGAPIILGSAEEVLGYIRENGV